MVITMESAKRTIEKDAHALIATGPPPLPQPANESFSQQTIDDTAREIFQDVFGDSQAELGGETPISNPTRSNDSASGVTSDVLTQSGNTTPTSNQLQYLMRQGTGFYPCALPLKSSFNTCEAPAGVPSNSMAAIPDADGCEIAIVLPNSIEAYAYRRIASQGSEWQDCWNSFANIIET